MAPFQPVVNRHIDSVVMAAFEQRIRNTVTHKGSVNYTGAEIV